MLKYYTVFGIDTFCYYYRLTSRQKYDVIERLKELPKFYTVISDYRENTYSYRSDYFVGNGVRIWGSRYKGNPWGLLIVVHPMLVLGNSDHSALYWPHKKSEYQKIVKKVDKLLETVNVPCSVDKMKFYRVDVTLNRIFGKNDLPDEYIRIIKKSPLLPHYKLDFFREKEHKAKDCKLANKHSHKQSCKSAAFFAYDKTAQLGMIDKFPAALIDKRVLRLEAQLRRNGMRKWVGKKGMKGSNWSILKKLGESSEEILQWYLKRLQPVNMSYVCYSDAVDMIEKVKGKKNRERMLYLLKKTSDSESLTTALEKLREKYNLSKGQCGTVLKKFKKLGVSLITLKNGSDYDKLPPFLG